MTLILGIIQAVCIAALSPLCIGIIRTVKARMQNRKGASPLQPYRDLRKLFRKDEVMSRDASWVFRFAPIVIFATTLVIAASIPTVTALFPNRATGDLLAVVYLFALGTFALALAGIDTGGAFGGFGSSREMMVAALTEGGLVLALLVPAFLSGTSNLGEMSGVIAGLASPDFRPLVLAGIAFVIAFLAENARYPFDNPATHLELTMIHEAMILEYSGKRLALIEWASANKFLLLAIIGANAFAPWGLATAWTLPALLLASGILAGKVLLCVLGVAVLESSMAKLRIFRLPDLLFTSFIVSAIAIGFVR